MASKRSIQSISASANEDIPSQPASKRQRGKASSTGKPQQHEQKTDPTYGQRCAFPGLDESVANTDEDLEFEDDQDALAYLRAVRREANGIPTLLVAPRAATKVPHGTELDYDDSGVATDRSIYEDGRGDSRGYYEDGAYTAAPDTSLNGDQGGGGGDRLADVSYDDDDEQGAAIRDDARDNAANATRIRDAYFASLAAQFSSLRALLHQEPPIEALLALPRGSQDYEVHPFGPSPSGSGRDGRGRSDTFSAWSGRMRRFDPLPAQVASMDKRGVVRLLRVLLGGKFLRRGAELRERTSRWLWALLARLPDRGELDHVEVGVVRDLGKRAVLLLVSLAHAEALRDEVPGLDGEEDGDGEEEEWTDEWDDPGEEGEGTDQVVERRGEEANGNGAPPHHKENRDTAEPLTEGTAAGSADEEAEMEDGEVPDEPTTSADLEADIAAAKARLLADLEGAGAAEDDGGEAAAAASDPAQSAAEEERQRAKINTRATLNMILTVAGEFYGQRDLLEFRDPFTGL
ncbi:Snare complex subunit vam7 [Pleurostoma richardsiae]|uniref:Snare complex subunit vam7 n=1 Tax=Pleurostoma richardsiae TaxID=41990 RepID=A0AA38RNP1_9PEZI|nr:Snare complex subunit vam7 [Pleurostoma richardsiae]